MCTLMSRCTQDEGRRHCVPRGERGRERGGRRVVQRGRVQGAGVGAVAPRRPAAPRTAHARTPLAFAVDDSTVHIPQGPNYRRVRGRGGARAGGPVGRDRRARVAAPGARRAPVPRRRAALPPRARRRRLHPAAHARAHCTGLCRI
ncbi:hypothetical protein O3G_MSEX001048, partial [Manduca sexta]